MLSTLGYAAFYDQINTTIKLVTMPKPSIAVSAALINAPTNEVAVTINNETKTILNTDPEILQAQIAITNNGTTPINALTINITLPTDWNWNQQLSAVITRGNATTQIPETNYTTNYDQTTQILLITIPDIEAATGEKQNQNHILTVTFTTEYSLKEQPLPPEYENTPPTYTITATVTSLTSTGGWESDPACIGTSFSTLIFPL